MSPEEEGLGCSAGGGAGGGTEEVLDEEEEDETGASTGWSIWSLATGAVPQRPRTQPPTRRVRGILRVGVTVALELSLSTDEASWCLAAATEARRVCGDWPALRGPLSAVTVLVEITGGVADSSAVDDTIRCGMRMGRVPVRSLMREGWWLGVWMSIPATENRLS